MRFRLRVSLLGILPPAGGSWNPYVAINPNVGLHVLKSEV